MDHFLKGMDEVRPAELAGAAAHDFQRRRDAAAPEKVKVAAGPRVGHPEK